MPFSTTPVAGPMSVKENSAPSPAQQAAKARAIALLSGQSPKGATSTPVQNATKVAAEEMSVVTPTSQVGDSLQAALANAKAPETTEEVPNPTEQPDNSGSPETTPEVTAKPKEEPLSAQYAQLARKEKAIRAQAMQVKAKEAEFAAKEAEFKVREAKITAALDLERRMTEDPLSTLLERGVTYDQLTQQALNQNQLDPATKAVINELKQQVKSLSEGLEKSNKAAEDRQTQSYSEAINQIRNEAKQLVNTDPYYETIKETDQVEAVVKLIERTWEKDKVLLTVEEAAREVEDYTVEQIVAQAAKNKKIQERMKPKPAPAATTTTQAASGTLKTLTNSTAGTPKLSARDRAILAARGELKQ